MGFIVKMTHKVSGESVYYGAIPMDRIPVEHREDDADFQTHVFHTLDGAKEFSFPSVFAATSCLAGLGHTKNLDFEIVEVANNPDMDPEFFQEPDDAPA